MKCGNCGYNDQKPIGTAETVGLKGDIIAVILNDNGLARMRHNNICKVLEEINHAKQKLSKGRKKRKKNSKSGKR
jgi:hypothetical protein